MDTFNPVSFFLALMFCNCQGLACRILLDKAKAGSVKHHFEGVEVILMVV